MAVLRRRPDNRAGRAQKILELTNNNPVLVVLWTTPQEAVPRQTLRETTEEGD